MALKDIAINIKATGVEQTTQGLKKVEGAAESMGRKVTSVTASAQAGYARAEKAMHDHSGATGRAAAEMDKLTKSAGAMGGSMHGHTQRAYMGMSSLEMGIMGVTMRVMNLAMAAGLIAAPFVGFFAMMKGGISIVDDFAVSVIQIAAQLTQMYAGNGDGIAETFERSAAYAGVMAEKLEEIDANSFANNKGLEAMLQTMTMQGTVLDVNNDKQIESFTALSNAIAMYTAGQDQEIQARQEMRALLTGEVNQHSQLARIIDTQIKAEGVYKGGLKEVVELGKQHGDTLERFAPYLVGVNAASELISKTWTAASSSLETAVNKVTREGFKEVFEEVVPLASQLATWLKSSSAASDIIHKVWLAGRGVISAVVDILRGPMWVLLAGVGGLTAKILDGWGLLLSSVLPVLADEFRHLISMLNAMVNMGMAFGLVMLDAVGAVGSAIASVGKAAFQALTGDFESAGETLQGMFSGVYVEKFKGNLDVVKGTMVAIREEAAAMRDPIGKMLDNADRYLAKTGKTRGAATAPPPPPPPPGEGPDGLDLEAYERELEKFHQAYGALNNAYSKAALEDLENASALQLAELDNRHKQGLISEQQYLDDRYKLAAASSDREISLLMAAAERAQEALDKAKASPALDRPADGADDDVVDRYNNAVMVRVNAEKDLVEAIQKVAAATAKAKLADVEYAGATKATTLNTLKDQYGAEIALAQALGDTYKATMLQIESDNLSRTGLDERTRATLALVDAKRLEKAEYEKVNEAMAVQRLQLTNQLALVDAAEEFNRISTGRAAEARIEILQKQLELEQKSYENIKGSTAQDDFLRQQKLATITEISRSILAQQDIINDRTAYGGAISALHDYAEAAADVGSQISSALTSAFSSAEDAITQMLTTGKASFKSFADSVIADLARMAVKQYITGPISSWLSNLPTADNQYGMAAPGAGPQQPGVTSQSSGFSAASMVPVVGMITGVASTIMAARAADQAEWDRLIKAVEALRHTMEQTNKNLTNQIMAGSGDVNAAERQSLLDAQEEKRYQIAENYRDSTGSHLSVENFSEEGVRQLLEARQSTGRDGLDTGLQELLEIYEKLTIREQQQVAELENKQQLQTTLLLMEEMELKGLKESAGYRDLLNKQREAEMYEMDDANKAIQTRINLLIDEQTATEKANALKEANQNLALREWRALGNDNQAALYAQQIEQEKEIAEYLKKGLDVARLQTVQGLERNKLLKDIEESSTATARAASETLRATMANSALAAANALRSIVGGDLSTLSPEAKYLQLKQSYMRDAYTDKGVEIGQALLEASRSYNGATGAGYIEDYNWVTRVMGEMAGITTDPTLEAINAQIGILEAIRDNTALTVTAATTLNQLIAQQEARQNADRVMEMVTQLRPVSLAYDLNNDGAITIGDALGYLRMSQGLPGFATGGNYPGGLSIMGEIGPELVDSAPGYVYRADETRALFAMARRGVAVADNYGSGASKIEALLEAVVAENRELRRELADLRSEVRASVRVQQDVGKKLIDNTGKQADELTEIRKNAALGG